jgi:hypothetical protein
VRKGLAEIRWPFCALYAGYIAHFAISNLNTARRQTQTMQTSRSPGMNACLRLPVSSGFTFDLIFPELP